MKKLLVLLVLLSCTKEDETMRMFITPTVTETTPIVTSKTIYEIGGVANDSGVDNSVVINSAISEGYEVTFPDAGVFYISNPIIYDGNIKLTGTQGSESTIKLAPNSNVYMIRPASNNNNAYEILHERVDLTDLIFDGDYYSGNDVRDIAGEWDTNHYGFGMVLANTRYIVLTRTTHQNAENWNVCTLGNYELRTYDVTVKYTGVSTSTNGDGISGPNKRVFHSNLTSDGLKDDTTGMGNGNGTFGTQLVGMNYYIDVEIFSVIGANIINTYSSIIGLYPNSAEYNEIYIENYEYEGRRYGMYVGSYWPSRPITTVDKITIKNCIIHIDNAVAEWNENKFVHFDYVKATEVYIQNITIIDDRTTTTPDITLIFDEMDDSTLYIDNINGNAKSNITLYNGTSATGHTYITNNNLTASGFTVTESIGVKPVN